VKIVGYHTIHYRLKSHRGPAWGYRCCGCGLLANEWAYDHKDPNEVMSKTGSAYSLDLAYYIPMCGICHFRFDVQHMKSYIEGRRKMCYPGYPTEWNRKHAEETGWWPPPSPPEWPLGEDALPLRWD